MTGLPVVAHDPALGKLIEGVRATYDYMPTALSGYLAGVGVVTTLYWGIAPMSVVLPWITAFVVMCAVRMAVTLHFRRSTPTVCG